MTDNKYHARNISYFYSVWIPNFELRFLLERTGAAPAEEAPAAEVEAS